MTHACAKLFLLSLQTNRSAERRLLHQYKKLLNKVTFVFFAHKKYSHSVIKWRLNTDVAWTILTKSLLRFLALLSMQGQKALGFHQKYLNLCFENEWRSYWFGTTWLWVINDRIKIFGLTIPLTLLAECCFQLLPSSSKFTLWWCNTSQTNGSQPFWHHPTLYTTVFKGL